jgi:V/A-type H+-transporting ATPase subunit D
MLHQTRTTLLLLKEKVASVANSIDILQSRRQALIEELLTSSRPYFESRKKIQSLYGSAIHLLKHAVADQGPDAVFSLAGATGQRNFYIDITPRNIWGVQYKEIKSQGTVRRSVDERGYDYRMTPAVTEECFSCFEEISDDILELAIYDNKIKKLAEEVRKTTRKMRVLEENVLPSLKKKIRIIGSYLAERERETHYRLKQFKRLHENSSQEHT